MNWDAIGAGGEILGAIAVLATLIYLASQIKQANRFESAKHLDVHMDRIREFTMEIGRDPETSRIWYSGLAGDELTRDEQRQFVSLAMVRILIQRDAWLRAGILENVVEDSEIYLRILAGLIVTNPGLKRIWEKTYIPQVNSSGNVNQAFVNRTAEIIEERLSTDAPHTP
jgi:hypothetical protein